MKVLLLYKMSTFQYFQDLPPGECPDLAEVNRFKDTHEIHYCSLEKIEVALREKGFDYRKVERGQLKDYSGFDFIITVGGDGTFLEGARYITDQPILGVNSDPAWSVGHLCLATQETIGKFLDVLKSDDVKFGALNRMKISFVKSGRSAYFINDILVSHLNPSSLSRYLLKIDGRCEEQRSSGVWFATAAGSTGAVHSAGGSVLDLASNEIVYMPRELYRGWTKNEYHFTGGVLPAETHIELVSFMAEGMVFIDGSHQRIPFTAPENIIISRAETPLRLITLQ